MPNGVKSPAVAKAMTVLALLSERSVPLSATVIARSLSLPRTSIDRICEALREERLLTKGSDGTYWLGPRAATLGAAARSARPRILTVGVLVPDRRNSFYDAFFAAAQAWLADGGDVLLERSADGDLQRQQAQWRDLLAEGVDVVLIDAVATHGFDDVVVESHRRDIPVVAIGTRIAGVDVSVTSDNMSAGVLAGLELARISPAGARLAIIDGLQKSANKERITGFLDALSDFPNHQVVAQVRADAEDERSGQTVMRELTAHLGEIDGVFAVCDPLALGAGDQLNDGPHRTYVTSVDGRSRAVREIEAGGSLIATVAQDPAGLARAAIACARELCDGYAPRQRIISLPVRVITRLNASRYQPWG